MVSPCEMRGSQLYVNLGQREAYSGGALEQLFQAALLYSRSPIGGCTVMLMRACLPVTIGPRVIAERRRILEVGLGYSSAITAEGRIVF